jgi:hypothetical protein
MPHDGLTLRNSETASCDFGVAGPVGGRQGAPLDRIALICESLGEGVDYRSLRFSRGLMAMQNS